jgi:two-component system KDP operon response regulator KdpE
MVQAREQQVVLVIDDEPPVRRYLRTMLELDGYAVYEAMNGPMGLGLVPVVAPTVVLLDVMMPGMDGVDVCAEMSATWPWLPIVILTARDDRALEDRCYRAGAARFVTKPLLSGQLADVLADLVTA